MGGIIVVIPLGAHDTPISHGTIDYQPNAYRADINDPNSDWLVELPPHVAEPLLHNAGFFVMTPTSYVVHSAGTIRMYHPERASCSWNGIKFTPDKHGVFEIPVEGAAEMQSHGLKSAPEGHFFEAAQALNIAVEDVTADQAKQFVELTAVKRADKVLVEPADESKPTPKAAKVAKS